jgi:hypothetical protein
MTTDRPADALPAFSIVEIERAGGGHHGDLIGPIEFISLLCYRQELPLAFNLDLANNPWKQPVETPCTYN